MLLLNKTARNPECMSLAIQAMNTPGAIARDLAHKIHAWAPSGARSFTVFAFVDTDYHHCRSAEPTGYASASVRYFSTLKEGTTPLLSGGWAGLGPDEGWSLHRTTPGALLSRAADE